MLPLAAIVAYAAACAMRLREQIDKARFGEANEASAQAIKIARNMSTGMVPRSADVADLAKAAMAAAADAAKAANAIEQMTKGLDWRKSALAGYAIACGATYAAYHAAFAARCGYIGDIVGAASHAADAAGPEGVGVYESLVALAHAGSWDHSRRVPEAFFLSVELLGSNSVSTPETIEIEPGTNTPKLDSSHAGETGTGSEPLEQVGDPGLVIVFDCELISPEDYGELVSAIGDIVRAEGGAGVKQIKQDGYGVARAVEPAVQ